MNDTKTLRMERTFRAPAEAVFEAWTSEEVLRRWFHAEHDWETTEAEVDLRVGGTLRVVMRNPHDDVEHGGGGSYTEVDPPTRLAFTWIWDDYPERKTLIELDFRDAMASPPSASPTAACGTRRPSARTRADGRSASTTSSARWKPPANRRAARKRRARAASIAARGRTPRGRARA